jgi:hypothetical protein
MLVVRIMACLIKLKQTSNCMRFEFITTVTIWHVAPFNLQEISRRFRGTYWFRDEEQTKQETCSKLSLLICPKDGGSIVTHMAIARQRLGKNPFRSYGRSNKASAAGYRTNEHAAITIGYRNKRCFLCGPRQDCLLDNCVVTRLCNNRGTVFSVLRGPCRDYIREAVWRIDRLLYWAWTDRGLVYIVYKTID